MHRRSQREGECHDADLTSTRFDELRGLGNVLSQHEPVFHLVVDLEMSHRRNGGAAVGRVLRVGNRDFLDGLIAQRLEPLRHIATGLMAGPEDNPTDSVAI